jgi:hypothetical protein
MSVAATGHTTVVEDYPATFRQDQQDTFGKSPEASTSTAGAPQPRIPKIGNEFSVTADNYNLTNRPFYVPISGKGGLIAALELLDKQLVEASPCICATGTRLTMAAAVREKQTPVFQSTQIVALLHSF